MRGIRPLACRRLMDLRHRNIWCILPSGISRETSLLKKQMHFCRPSMRKILPMMRQTVPRRLTRSPLGSPRFFRSVPSALRQTSIFPFTGSCSAASTPMPGASGTTTSQRRNGCWMERPCSTAAPRSCGQRWTMTFPRRRIFPTRISRWMRSSTTLRYSYPDCGRSMYSARATPERRRYFSSSICARWALM